MIFVFGSNLAGIHGAGAAKYAYEHAGAIWGESVGHRGMSYAIPTKDFNIQALPLDIIKYFIDSFIEYARNTPTVQYQITRIGCGLAGFKDEEIAPLFINASNNCHFDEAWKPYLPGKNFWGTY